MFLKPKSDKDHSVASAFVHKFFQKNGKKREENFTALFVRSLVLASAIWQFVHDYGNLALITPASSEPSSLRIIMRSLTRAFATRINKVMKVHRYLI